MKLLIHFHALQDSPEAGFLAMSFDTTVTRSLRDWIPSEKTGDCKEVGGGWDNSTPTPTRITGIFRYYFPKV